MGNFDVSSVTPKLITPGAEFTGSDLFGILDRHFEAVCLLTCIFWGTDGISSKPFFSPTLTQRHIL
jgi:hypothetical protein